jgi:hypothetical protein
MCVMFTFSTPNPNDVPTWYSDTTSPQDFDLRNTKTKQAITPIMPRFMTTGGHHAGLGISYRHATASIMHSALQELNLDLKERAMSLNSNRKKHQISSLRRNAAHRRPLLSLAISNAETASAPPGEPYEAEDDYSITYDDVRRCLGAFPEFSEETMAAASILSNLSDSKIYPIDFSLVSEILPVDSEIQPIDFSFVRAGEWSFT